MKIKSGASFSILRNLEQRIMLDGTLSDTHDAVQQKDSSDITAKTFEISEQNEFGQATKIKVKAPEIDGKQANFIEVILPSLNPGFQLYSNEGLLGYGQKAKVNNGTVDLTIKYTNKDNPIGLSFYIKSSDKELFGNESKHKKINIPIVEKSSDPISPYFQQLLADNTIFNSNLKNIATPKNTDPFIGPLNFNETRSVDTDTKDSVDPLLDSKTADTKERYKAGDKIEIDLSAIKNNGSTISILMTSSHYKGNLIPKDSNGRSLNSSFELESLTDKKVFIPLPNDYYGSLSYNISEKADFFSSSKTVSDHSVFVTPTPKEVDIDQARNQIDDVYKITVKDVPIAIAPTDASTTHIEIVEVDKNGLLKNNSNLIKVGDLIPLNGKTLHLLSSIEMGYEGVWAAKIRPVSLINGVKYTGSDQTIQIVSKNTTLPSKVSEENTKTASSDTIKTKNSFTPFSINKQPVFNLLKLFNHEPILYMAPPAVDQIVVSEKPFEDEKTTITINKVKTQAEKVKVKIRTSPNNTDLTFKDKDGNNINDVKVYFDKNNQLKIYTSNKDFHGIIRVNVQEFDSNDNRVKNTNKNITVFPKPDPIEVTVTRDNVPARGVGEESGSHINIFRNIQDKGEVKLKLTDVGSNGTIFYNGNIKNNGDEITFPNNRKITLTFKPDVNYKGPYTAKLQAVATRGTTKTLGELHTINLTIIDRPVLTPTPTPDDGLPTFPTIPDLGPTTLPDPETEDLPNKIKEDFRKTVFKIKPSPNVTHYRIIKETKNGQESKEFILRTKQGNKKIVNNQDYPVGLFSQGVKFIPSRNFFGSADFKIIALDKTNNVSSNPLDVSINVTPVPDKLAISPNRIESNWDTNSTVLREIVTITGNAVDKNSVNKVKITGLSNKVIVEDIFGNRLTRNSIFDMSNNQATLIIYQFKDTNRNYNINVAGISDFNGTSNQGGGNRTQVKIITSPPPETFKKPSIDFSTQPPVPKADPDNGSSFIPPQTPPESIPARNNNNNTSLNEAAFQARVITGFTNGINRFIEYNNQGTTQTNQLASLFTNVTSEDNENEDILQLPAEADQNADDQDKEKEVNTKNKEKVDPQTLNLQNEENSAPLKTDNLQE